MGQLFLVFFHRLLDVCKTGSPGPRATCALQAGVGGTASCSASSCGGS